MYAVFLLVHSWIRWVALGAGLAATLSAWGAGDRDVAVRDRWGLVLTIALDLQLVIGLLLYFVVSPTMEAIRAQMSDAMRNPQLRFFAVEHVAGMFVALVLVHVGRVLARKAKTPSARRTRLVVSYGLATLIMVLSTPWPGMPYGRPLLRF